MMFFNVFYPIPLGVTTWILSEKELQEKWHTLLNFGLYQIENLYSVPRTEYLLYGYENSTQNTKYCTLTNTFDLTKFGSVMNKL